MVQEGGLRDVWVYDIARRGLTRLTLGDADNSSPSWSPDGRQITFLRNKDGNSYIVVKSADGSGAEETLAALPRLVYSSSWSPDGKFIAYSQIGRNGKSEIWVLPVGGEHKPQPFLASQFDEGSVAFSPDGKYLAYVSNESGYNEVYVVPFGHGSGKWPISTGGGNSNFLVWSKNGKELFYREDGNIVGVDITTQPVFSPSAPHVIVPAKSLTNISSRFDNFDVSPDGKRFLIHQQSSEAGQSVQINFVLNWNEELRRLSSAGKQP